MNNCWIILKIDSHYFYVPAEVGAAYYAFHLANVANSTFVWMTEWLMNEWTKMRNEVLDSTPDVAWDWKWNSLFWLIRGWKIPRNTRTISYPGKLKNVQKQDNGKILHHYQKNIYEYFYAASRRKIPFEGDSTTYV